MLEVITKPFIWTWERMKDTGRWIKTNIKKVLIGAGIVGIAIAGGVTLLPENQPPCIDFNGQEICFPYTDGAGDKIQIYTDKSHYNELSEADIYLAVKNEAQSQNINLHAYFEGTDSELVKLERFIPDVPYTVIVPDYADVEHKYSCEADDGMEGTTKYCISDPKDCEGKAVEEKCVQEEKVGEHEETRYKDEWQEETLNDVTEQEKIEFDLKRDIQIADKFKAQKTATRGFQKDEIVYYKAKVNFPVRFGENPEQEFLLEAVGEVEGVKTLDPWFSSSWSSRKKITIQGTNVDSNLSDFPLYVKIDADSDLSEAQDDGEDIRFTSSDGETEIPYERESWSGGGGSAVTADFWVKTGVQSDGSTEIYIYYGNDGASDGEDATNAWDDNYISVYHMDDVTTSTIADSTSNGLDGDKYQANGPTEINGKIGKAQSFDGNNDYILIADNALHDTGGAITMEAWAFPDLDSTAADAIMVHDISSYKWLLYCTSGEVLNAYVRTSTTYSTGNTGSYSDQWVHAVATFDRTLGSNRLKLYTNGTVEEQNNANDADIAAGDQGVYIGTQYNRTTNGFDGYIDEVRISDIARSADWIKFEYYNMNEADNELTFGSEEEEEAAETTGDSYYFMIKTK